jgi:hypothetical protein
MSFPTHGTVRNGVVIPDAPLPEGMHVEIRPYAQPPDIPADLEGELRAWRQASANALDLVERLASEEPGYEAR